MLIARCAWHPRYYGFGKLLGVSSWRGMELSFTDGICRKCAARVRGDFRFSRSEGRVPAGRPGLMPGIAVVALAVMAAIVLIARPTHEMPAPVRTATRPLVAQAPPPPVERARPIRAAQVSRQRVAPASAAPSAGIRDLPSPGVRRLQATTLEWAKPLRESTQSP